MHAIAFDRLRMIVFSPDPVPPDARAELLDAMGGTLVGEDAEVAIPDDIRDWPRGADRPENVLAVARDQPRHFRVFEYRREIDQDRYEPTGMRYAVVPSWERFLEAYRPLVAISKIIDASNRPGLDEKVMRGIDANRPPGYRLFEGVRCRG